MRMKNESVPYGNGGGYGVDCGSWEGVVGVPSSDAHHAVWGNPSGRQQTLVRMRVGIAEEAPSLIICHSRWRLRRLVIRSQGSKNEKCRGSRCSHVN